MANFVPNIAKGKLATLAGLPAANDALILVLLQAGGTDDQLKDADTLAAVVAIAAEATITGYARRTLATVTVTVDDSGNATNIDAADPAAYTITGTQAVTRAAICYDPDTTTGTDADLIPLAILDCAVTLEGVVTLSFHASGFAYAEDA